MPLERLLQINMAALASLGALLLGMGARSEGPPLVVIVATALSVWLTDVTGRFAIGRRVSHVLMLVAAAVAMQNLLWVRNELQALNFAWLVIFIQLTLFFQRKDGRAYWLLVLLSLLQVVIATLFSQGIWFGLLLGLYMLVGFSAMTLLLLYRQWERFARDCNDGRPLESAMDGMFTSHPGEGRDAAVGPSLFRRLGIMGVQTLALTLVLFFALPRFGQFSWGRAAVSSQPLVGFSDEVRLGELAPIIESREEVMRLRFETHPDAKPLTVRGDIYLQGALLVDYAHGQWQAGVASSRLGSAYLLPDRSQPSGIVRQRIVIEGMDHDHLFFVAPYLAVESNAAVEIDNAHERLRRHWHFRDRRFEYTLGTTAIVDGQQRPLSRVLPECKDVTPGTKAKPDNLPNLTALATRWIKESRLPEQDRVGRARYLERQLSRSDLFRYSLTGVERDTSIDPIEDFVTRHPQG
ncbi:MAG: DUF3488 domain-containing protein, partial [Planctomycetaceae bacterium]|nr:DUF3488 domain-containing protein [Planctomycetaceae bacterium]